MGEAAKHDAWSAGRSYERYMGRWSREIAGSFVDWLEAPREAQWLDVGCGTGALSQTILDRCNPKSLLGIDPSDGFVAHARSTIEDGRAQFQIGDAQKLSAKACSGFAMTPDFNRPSSNRSRYNPSSRRSRISGSPSRSAPAPRPDTA